MFRKKNKLPSFLFPRVLKDGEKKENNYFKIVFKKNDFSFPRVGIIVSSKVSKLAVKRNLLKRRIRNIIKEFLPLFSSNWDIIIIAKKDLLSLSYSQEKEELKKILSRILKLK